MDREYVILSLRHTGIIKDALLFWGVYTQDKEERSFGGYTVDITKCEKYTLEEIQKEKIKIYGIDFKDQAPKTIDDYAIKISDLFKLGYRKFTVITK